MTQLLECIVESVPAVEQHEDSIGSQRVLWVAFDKSLVSFYRAFEVVFLFRSLRGLPDLRRIAAYFFLARCHILRFLARSKNDRGPAQFGYEKHNGNQN